MRLSKYQSPHRPGDDNLRRTIERTARRNARREARTKGKAMNWKLKATAGSALIAIGIAGAVMGSDGAPPDINRITPGACFESVSGALVCDEPTTDASVSTLTPRDVVDVSASEIETVHTLPFTGTGSTSK